MKSVLGGEQQSLPEVGEPEDIAVETTEQGEREREGRKENKS